MLELGCFWALWTIVFGKYFPNSELIVLEGNQEKLAVGLTNLMNNGLSARAHFNTINVEHSRSKPEFGELVEDTTLTQIIEVNNIKSIDLLHMDIQGSEEGLYFEIFELIRKGLIHNVIMGTHSDELHEKILLELDSLTHLVTVSAIPYIPGSGDGEIIIKRRY